MFPPEILEKILYHCDGRTLLTAKNVNKDWKQIVEYLTKETNVWMKCCIRDIPEAELIDYKNKWVGPQFSTNKTLWLHMYENWINWHNIKNNISFETLLKGHVYRIACINTRDKYIALGMENGCVKIFDDNFKRIKNFRHLNVTVNAVYIVLDESTGQPTEVLSHYSSNMAYITPFNDGDQFQPGTFPNCFKFSSYKNFICGVSQQGKITIAKLTTDHINRKKSFSVITYVRMYSPKIVTDCKLWEGECIILIDSHVKIIKYDENNLRCNMRADKKTTIEWHTNDIVTDRANNVIMFNNKIIIALNRYHMNQQMFELFILGENNLHSKKMFVPWQTFIAEITTLFLHGNTFVIGLNNGLVYFYDIHDWKLFDIGSYNHVESVAEMCPIISINVKESHGKRIFFITTYNKVFEITGHSICENYNHRLELL